MSTNFHKENKKQRKSPSTSWRSSDPDFPNQGLHGIAPAAGNRSDHREVFAVVNHEGVQALYQWREDAVSHAKVCAGTVQTMRINYELPAWVQVMVDHAASLAVLQSPQTKSRQTIH